MRNVRIDENITCRVTDALWSDPFVQASDICVHVFDGTVMLTGEVATETQRLAIGRLVADLICVEGLTNAITVTDDVADRIAA